MSDCNDLPDSNNEEQIRSTVSEYMQRAIDACAAGDARLGMHLYLAAFEEGTSDDLDRPCEEALIGMKEAWTLACMLKERSMAEYIFEKMEPYLGADELAVCAEELQSLAFDKLEEYGLSRDDLEDMAEMISDDFLGLGVPFSGVEHMYERMAKMLEDADIHDVADILDDFSSFDEFDIDDEDFDDFDDDDNIDEEDIDEEDEDDIDEEDFDEGVSQGAIDEAPKHADIHVSFSKGVHVIPQSNAADAKGSNGVHASDADNPSKNEQAAGAHAPANVSLNLSGGKKIPKMPSDNSIEFHSHSIEGPTLNRREKAPKLDYAHLAGYDNAVEIMHDLGIGMNNDEDYKNLVSLLNEHHGLSSMPVLDTLLFRAPAHEDANHFVAATLGELKMPALRMSMEENLQGLPVLCVMVQSENAPKLNATRSAFEGGGVLVLEDIDEWSTPFVDLGDDAGNFLMMQLSRGAREAMNLIRSAVENPDVYVFATASSASEIDPFFLDLLEPVSFIDIDYPDPSERASIWEDIASDHPSLRGFDRAELVRLSVNMPRVDIYMAAREAVDEAYKEGLMARRYRPVTRDNLFDKLAAYQPLESTEYQELEDAVISEFHLDLDHIDDLLDDEE